MRDLLFVILSVVAIFVCLTRAELAIAFWYWISLFQPQTQSWGFARSVPFGIIAGVIALVSWALSSGRKIPPRSSIVVALILLGIWTTLTTINAAFPSYAYVRLNEFISILVMVLLGTAILQTRARMEILIWTICGSIGFYGLKTGLFGLRGGIGADFHGPSYMGANNELARGMMFVIPLLIYLYMTRKELWVRIGIAFVAAGSVLTIILSGSRGAWLGALAMVGFAALRLKRGLLWLCVAAALSAAALPLLPDSIVDRFMTISDYKTDASVQGRFGSWMYALEKFPERPIMGGGFGIFENEHNKASHNSFIQVLGEHGAVGLLLFSFLLAAAALTTVRIIKVTKLRPNLKWARDLAYLIQITLVGYVVGSISINHAFFPVFYAVLGLLVSLQVVVRQEIESAPGMEISAQSRRKRERFKMPIWPPPVPADLSDDLSKES